MRFVRSLCHVPTNHHSPGSHCLGGCLGCGGGHSGLATADTTTPPRWARAIRDALLAAGKDVTYFDYEGQGHALKGDAWRAFMQRTADFFAEHL